uniref:DNA-directed DNA polymerase n=1 Tax=Setaria viridis TaxID=4556 RepID=A0A4U6W4Y6_SETVI|nr:hypothetical protein SEVIR_2G440533v2 [Setaria viridis]
MDFFSLIAQHYNHDDHPIVTCPGMQVNRTSEFARVFGIDFFSVLSRGSQYRVESMLLRLAHTQNYLAISPGNQQVASQPAMECLPLVMEPESAFYPDPVVVLDFQSLYPSMIIAYNLCYSTCLGKLFPSRRSAYTWRSEKSAAAYPKWGPVCAT